MTFKCPQCGCETESLHEGYCEDCQRENQAELDDHNHRSDDWNRLSDSQKEARIRDALRLSNS